MTKNKKIRIIFYALAIFLFAYFVFGLFHQKPWPAKYVVQNITGSVYFYNDTYKILPDCLTEKNFPLSKTPHLIYSRNGMKDSKGNVWLVVLQAEIPSTYYAGKINEKDWTVEKITGDAVFEQQMLKANTRSRPVQKKEFSHDGKN